MFVATVLLLPEQNWYNFFTVFVYFLPFSVNEFAKLGWGDIFTVFQITIVSIAILLCQVWCFSCLF